VFVTTLYDVMLMNRSGGRFREQYYWDSFWIVEGLLESELYDIANATLQNFMDEIENIGFIPNGGRIYCVFCYSFSWI
jgi:neutral trehalase